MTSMLDLMPAPGLIFNEWDKHGTCSGVGERGYFETIRKARAAVKIPEEFLGFVGAEDDRARRLEEAFIKVNPGLSSSAISVTCESRRFSEVRVCLSKDLQFRACEEIDRRACRRDQVLMPPVRAAKRSLPSHCPGLTRASALLPSLPEDRMPGQSRP